MTSQTFIVLSGALTFGVPVVLAALELLRLHPSMGDGDEPPREAPPGPAPRPLPACLLPASSPSGRWIESRFLEDA